MSSLQKVNLGTPPTAVDGDTARGANTKANANVDVLNAQAALTSAPATITSAQALTAAHVGKRVNINLAAAGVINVPSAATMGLDGIVHLRNLGSTLVTLAIAPASGDTIALTKLAAGESVVLDSDGVHAIGCLLRGRANTDSESVNGNLTVGGALSVTGTTKVIAHNASNQSVPAAAYTKITGWTSDLDQLGEFNASTGVLTVTKAGLYFCSAGLQFNTPSMRAGDSAQVAVAKNGTPAFKSAWFASSAIVTNPMAPCAAGLLNCAAGDTITVQGYQGSASSAILLGSTPEGNYFHAVRIA